jgi:hypothetical protein
METLIISKDGNTRLTLQPLSKKNNKLILFEIGNCKDLNQYGNPDEFWMSINREKLGELAEFINQYLENHK